ncbi:DUF4270 family protein [Tunicatimonas pelagia]|uniref:DUF4270 family protein n=1 Tax=Tunicatimonas pelagia TaxID=931531 RepID=UPI0026654D4D|nr:DUF4270 family protein [Tunicatimonas pelagia]WKN45927.1 DUF4270 family protein [Tunicatimonas pelagia]
MNLLVRKKLGWLFWLTPFLFSCESEEILSLPQEPGDQALSLLFKEIPLSYSLVQLDSVATNRLPNDDSYRFLAGTYRSEIFGETQATTFAELGVDTRAEVEAEDRYDSLVLILVNDYFYGDINQTTDQRIGIYPLLDTLARTPFYRTDEIPFSPVALAELNFIPNPKADSVADTLRVRLDNAFGQELFDLAQTDAAALTSDSAFREYFPGIAMTSLAGNSIITGFDPARLRLALYFSGNDEAVSSVYTFNAENAFNNIAADRSGTPLAGITSVNQRMMAPDSGFYLHSGTGLVPTLSIQPIINFIDTLRANTDQLFRVNRVEIYIGATPREEGLAVPDRIAAFAFEDDFSLIIDSAVISQRLVRFPVGLQMDTAPRNGVFSVPPTESSYQILMTQYTQNIINEAPNIVTEFRIQPLRTQLGRRLEEIVAEPDSIVAKVFYTLLE